MALSSEKKIRNLGIRATEARWEELNQLALNRRTSVQALVDEAVEQWLQRASGKPGVSGPDSISTDPNSITIESPVSPEPITVDAYEWERIEQLLEVLRGTVPKAKTALEWNLEAFSYLTQIAGPGLHVSAPASVPSLSEDQQRKIAAERDLEKRIVRELEKPAPGRADAEAERKAATGTGGRVRPGGKRHP